MVSGSNNNNNNNNNKKKEEKKKKGKKKTKSCGYFPLGLMWRLTFSSIWFNMINKELTAL